MTKAATGENRKNSGRRLFVLTLIEGIDDDEGQNARSFQRTNDDLLHLGTERLLSDSRIGPQDFSKLRISICELERECWEDRSDVAPGPCEPVEPEHSLALLVLQPAFEL